MKNRLSKILAASGVASRRKAEELIFQGRCSVNGVVVLVPQTMVDNDKDEIIVDGERIKKEERKVYYLLNKPVGFLCSNRRISKHTHLVIDLFNDLPFRFFTVGRLDKDTSGLLLVTNDGHFANSIIHPSMDVTKEYLAKTKEEIEDEHLKLLSKGTWVEGVFIRPRKVEKVRRGSVKITVAEGKKHEVRLLLRAAGLDVRELCRIRLGPFTLGHLQPGERRSLTSSEIKQFIYK